MQLPSGTWVRQVCERCRGLGKVDREAVASTRDVTDEGREPRSECEDPVENGRPMTVRPPFDPAEFARESDAKMRVATEAPALEPLAMGSPAGLAPLVTLLNEALDVAGSTPDVREIETLSGAQDALGNDAVPFLSVSHEDLARFDLGCDTLKLLARVNGISSLESICARAGVQEEEGAALLLNLAELGVVGFR